jgi:hypothetical protein
MGDSPCPSYSGQLLSVEVHSKLRIYITGIYMYIYMYIFMYIYIYIFMFMYTNICICISYSGEIFSVEVHSKLRFYLQVIYLKMVEIACICILNLISI